MGEYTSRSEMRRADGCPVTAKSIGLPGLPATEWKRTVVGPRDRADHLEAPSMKFRRKGRRVRRTDLMLLRSSLHRNELIPGRDHADAKRRTDRDPREPDRREDRDDRSGDRFPRGAACPAPRRSPADRSGPRDPGRVTRVVYEGRMRAPDGAAGTQRMSSLRTSSAWPKRT